MQEDKPKCEYDCSTLHMSNWSVGIQYGDEIPIRPCSCNCHLHEDNIHGEASRQAHGKPKFMCYECKIYIGTEKEVEEHQELHDKGKILKKPVVKWDEDGSIK